MRRGGGGDDDVGALELARAARRSATTAPPKRCGQRSRALARGGWRRTSCATPCVVQRLRGQLARLAGADDHDVRSARSPSTSIASVDRDGRRRDAARADRGLRAHALAGLQRGAEEAVGQRPGRAGGERHLVGALDLALDLGLADDHRLEAAGDAEELARGVAVARRVDRPRAARSGGCPARRASCAEHARSRPRPGRRRRGRARCGCRSRSRRPRCTLGCVDELGEQRSAPAVGAARGARAAPPARSCARCRAASSSLIAPCSSARALGLGASPRRRRVDAARRARRPRARCAPAWTAMIAT